MDTAIVSDLHLGTTSEADVASHLEVQVRLFEALRGADRIVVLGDLLELRERPAAAVLERARPFLEGLGEATAGKQLLLVPGNHDYQLVAPALDAARLDGDALAAEGTFDPATGELARRVASLMPDTEVVLAYPGVRLREDVYATHGHYLDAHLTVPRVECVVAAAVGRFTGALGDGRQLSPDAYEAAFAPVYAFAYNIAQGSSARAVTRGGSLSRAVWSRSSPDGRASLAGLALGRLAIPAAVAAINGVGLGPFRADISSLELRRAGLRAIADVVAALGVEADHVIFGHTHRAGPLAGEVEGWWLPRGTRLTNTGSWIYESVFLGGAGPDNPYWPGRVTWLGDAGAPELTSVLGDVDLSDVHDATSPG